MNYCKGHGLHFPPPHTMCSCARPHPRPLTPDSACRWPPRARAPPWGTHRCPPCRHRSCRCPPRARARAGGRLHRRRRRRGGRRAVQLLELRPVPLEIPREARPVGGLGEQRGVRRRHVEHEVVLLERHRERRVMGRPDHRPRLAPPRRQLRTDHAAAAAGDPRLPRLGERRKLAREEVAHHSAKGLLRVQVPEVADAMQDDHLWRVEEGTHQSDLRQLIDERCRLTHVLEALGAPAGGVAGADQRRRQPDARAELPDCLLIRQPRRRHRRRVARAVSLDGVAGDETVKQIVQQ